MTGSDLTCRRLARGRLQAHVSVGDLNVKMSGKEEQVVDLLRGVESITGERLPVPKWLAPHFVKPMEGQTSLLDEQPTEEDSLPNPSQRPPPDNAQGDTLPNDSQPSLDIEGGVVANTTVPAVIQGLTDTTAHGRAW